MSLESDIFKGRRFVAEKLLVFGFVKEGDEYLYRTDLCAGMYARLALNKDGLLSGRVYDADFNEEYTNFRLEEAVGAFVVGVRLAYISLLERLRDAVTEPLRFVTEQACRIDERIFEIYGVTAEFLWERYPFYGVFRNPTSGKWFGIIMDIDKSKVTSEESGATAVMNLKLDDSISDYLGKGAYPCFHMSKGSWVSVILDDRLSDEKVLEMVALSYRNTLKKKGKKA